MKSTSTSLSRCCALVVALLTLTAGAATSQTRRDTILLGRKTWDFSAGNIRRIGNDEIERATAALAAIVECELELAGDESAARPRSGRL